jgi:hypothetical protein
VRNGFVQRRFDMSIAQRENHVFNCFGQRCQVGKAGNAENAVVARIHGIQFAGILTGQEIMQGAPTNGTGPLTGADHGY